MGELSEKTTKLLTSLSVALGMWWATNILRLLNLFSLLTVSTDRANSTTEFLTFPSTSLSSLTCSFLCSHLSLFLSTTLSSHAQDYSLKGGVIQELDLHQGQGHGSQAEAHFSVHHLGLGLGISWLKYYIQLSKSIFNFSENLYKIPATMEESDAITKSSSVTSFTSDMLDNDDLFDVQNLEFESAPYDITTDIPGIGDVVIAKIGSGLPVTSNYYKNKEGSKAWKFLVSKALDVSILSEREIKKPKRVVAKLNPNSEELIDLGSNVSLLSSSIFEPVLAAKSHSASVSDQQVVFQNLLSLDLAAQPPHVVPDHPLSDSLNSSLDHSALRAGEVRSAGKEFRSMGEFLTHVDSDFVSAVIGGLEAGLRRTCEVKLVNKNELLPKENIGIIHALNQTVYNEFGPDRPDPKFCHKLAEILKSKYPQTFRVKKTVQTSFGSLEMKRNKGEGGHRDLVHRIGDNFYNKFTKKTVKRPEIGTENPEQKLASPGGKKLKKGYGVTAERYNYGKMSSKEEQEAAKNAFKKLYHSDSLEEKEQLTILARIYIQIQFRSLQPSQAAEDLKPLWSAGPSLLSSWFEWLVSGSRDGNLSVSADMQLIKVLNLVEQFIISKKGSSFEAEIEGVRESAELEYGNDIWFKIYLIKQLGKLFKNQAEKLIFIDGTDEFCDGPSEQEPNVFVTKQRLIGEDDYDERIVLSLRIGAKVIMEDITLSQALSGCIQLYFSFHLHYPTEADDLYQFVQRIFCNFREHEGARNKKNAVRKTFRDFEVGI